MRHPPQKINAWRTAADIFPPKDPKPEYATFARYTQEIVTLLDRTPRDRWASTKLLDGVYRSLYAAQLSHFLDHFAPHQFVILPFRHFIDEPTQTVNAIRRAVGLAPGQAFSKAPWAGKKLAK